MIRACMLFLAFGAGVAHAQQSALVGSWHLAYAAGARIENDVATPIMATGTLTIELHGDSLIGQLVADAAPGAPRKPPSRLGASALGSESTFMSKGEATVQTSHGKTRATITSTWKLRVKGDSLIGTVERVVEGLEGTNAGPQPVAGKRLPG